MKMSRWLVMASVRKQLSHVSVREVRFLSTRRAKTAKLFVPGSTAKITSMVPHKGGASHPLAVAESG